jgi:hypothetical protein
MTASRLQITFRGVNEGDDPKALPPGTLLRAENVRMDKARRLAKRYGIQPLVRTTTSGANVAAGVRLLLRGDDTSITDGETAWTYSSDLSKWRPIDRVSPWQITKRPHVDATRGVCSADCAVSGNLLISLSVTSSTGLPFWDVRALDTGAVIVPPTSITATSVAGPRVLVSGTKAYLLFSIAAKVQYVVIDLSTLTAGAVTDLVTDAAATATKFDAFIATPTTGAYQVPMLYLAYEYNTGASRLKVVGHTVSDMTARVSTTLTCAAGVACVAVTYATAPQKVAVIFNSGAASTALHLMGPECTGAVGGTITAAKADSVSIIGYSATRVLAGWTRNASDAGGDEPDYLTTALYDVADGTTQTAASQRITYGVRTISRPWLASSRYFVHAVAFVHPNATPSLATLAQPSSVVLEIEVADSLTGEQNSTHPHVGTLQNQTGWVGLPGSQMQPAADASGNVWILSPYRDREPDGYATAVPIPLGWDLFKLAPTAGDTYRAAKLGAGALLAGGAPAWHTGAPLHPYGFVHAPQILSITAGNTGAMANGVYIYRATNLWRDVNGVAHRSHPSPPVSVTVTGVGTGSANVVMSTSSISAKTRTANVAYTLSPVLLELWRTTEDGAVEYRLTNEPDNGVLFSDARAGSVSIVDTKADSDIGSGNPDHPDVTLASQPVLYAEAGELENVPPPALTTVVTHRGRLAGIGPDLRTVWLSKNWTLDTTVAPGFNEALTLTFAHDKMALASLDASLVVFGEDKIDLVNGDGPDDAGNGEWGVQAVHTDVGCVNPRSVVVSPLGVLFESRRGIELLDRGLTVGLIPGKDIGDTLASYPTITSAVLVAEESEVRFTCDNGTLSVVLVYDYLNKLWLTRKYTIGGTAQAKLADAALIDGVYTMLTATGIVVRETPDQYLDGSSYVETDIVLSPISAQQGTAGWGGDNMAWQRVKDLTLMGTSVANHNLAVSFAHNYANTYSQTHTFVANSAATAVGVRELARVTCALQKCQSIQIRIRDLTPTGAANGIANVSAGVTLEALCLRISPKEGVTKTSAGQQG